MLTTALPTTVGTKMVPVIAGTISDQTFDEAVVRGTAVLVAVVVGAGAEKLVIVDGAGVSWVAGQTVVYEMIVSVTKTSVARLGRAGQSVTEAAQLVIVT